MVTTGGRRERTVRPPRSAYITPEGYRVLRLELEQLWKVERPRVTNEVSEAAALGDRSENAEYIYGKRRLREIDARMRFLSKRLDEVEVWDRKEARLDRVFFGAWVTVEDEEGETQRYRLVGPDEFDVKKGLISIDSPLARALLGKAEDDEVRVKRPKGDATLVIIEIDYPEED